jgi:hypothetical protein
MMCKIDRDTRCKTFGNRLNILHELLELMCKIYHYGNYLQALLHFVIGLSLSIGLLNLLCLWRMLLLVNALYPICLCSSPSFCSFYHICPYLMRLSILAN